MKGFDVGTAALILSMAALTFEAKNYFDTQDQNRRLNRLETSMRTYCAGSKLEGCAKLDIPLDARRFDN